MCCLFPALTAGLAAVLAAGSAEEGRAGTDVPAARAGVSARRERALMGTTCSAEVLAKDEASAGAAAAAALDEIARLEGVLSTWRDDAEMSRANRAAQQGVAPLSGELAGALQLALRHAERTGGAFDPAVGALVDAWDLRGEGRVPGDAELSAARDATGFRLVRLDAAARTLAFASPRTWVDTGGFGKGLALDRAAEAARRAGASAGLFDFGGQLLAFGDPDQGSDWSVGVADPRERGEAVLLLRLTDASASTSAQSERSVSVGGRRIGHVLDPRDGAPVEFSGSATVVAATAAEADCLSTALLVLGPRHGLALARAEGLCAGFLVPASRDGRDVLVLDATPSFLELVAASSPDVVIRRSSQRSRSLPR